LRSCGRTTRAECRAQERRDAVELFDRELRLSGHDLSDMAFQLRGGELAAGFGDRSGITTSM